VREPRGPLVRAARRTQQAAAKVNTSVTVRRRGSGRQWGHPHLGRLRGRWEGRPDRGRRDPERTVFACAQLVAALWSRGRDWRDAPEPGLHEAGRGYSHRVGQERPRAVPAFGGRLSASDIKPIADYESANAGG